MLRVLHFSDVHVQVPLGEIPIVQMLNKRLLAAVNLRFRRWRRFVRAPSKLAALCSFARQAQVDFAICTGDLTALGTEPELRLARSCLQGLLASPLGLLSIPGNHDIYLSDALRDARFERHFGDVMKTHLPELSVDERWPVIRLVGDRLAVVAVNSARPNPLPWLSSGTVPPAQLQALSRALAHPEIARRFVLVATHYAPRRADGSIDNSLHGLDNADDLLRACAGLRRGAIVHGHIHQRYYLPGRGTDPPLLCAGSATHEGREGAWLFELSESRVHATPAQWSGTGYSLDPSRAVEVR
ncbi:MAG: metallophosphoesterase [Proteobacteria bacterium]|nr:metallophosphoesterase [Pseudomonadota bacterium]